MKLMLMWLLFKSQKRSWSTVCRVINSGVVREKDGLSFLREVLLVGSSLCGKVMFRVDLFTEWAVLVDGKLWKGGG